MFVIFHLVDRKLYQLFLLFRTCLSIRCRTTNSGSVMWIHMMLMVLLPLSACYTYLVPLSTYVYFLKLLHVGLIIYIYR